MTNSTTIVSSAVFAANFGIGDLRSPTNRDRYQTMVATIARAEEENQDFEASQAEAEEMALLPRSVVPIKYKVAYRAQAARLGRTSKADARCNGDWLARKLASLVLRTVIVETENGVREKKEILDVGSLETILDLNGIEQWRNWSRDSAGWQGRMRMNGSQMLRSRIAKAGTFVLPDGSTIEPPVAFTDKHI
jgi:hypothetical protein